MAGSKKQPSSGRERELTDLRNERVIFREVLTKGYGPQFLAWLGNECGAWNMDPDKKDGRHLPPNPYTPALFNRVLAKIGALHPFNLVTLTEGILTAINDDDLAEIRRQDQRKQEEQES